MSRFVGCKLYLLHVNEIERTTKNNKKTINFNINLILSSMKKKIINGLLFAVALVAATSSFVSCKDNNGDNYAELQEKYLTMQAAFESILRCRLLLTSRFLL